MTIKTEKNDVCPICHYQIISPNCWVRYHISYKPEMVILSCKYCNMSEYFLRNNIKRDTPKFNSRWRSVLLFQKKFGVII